MGRRIKKKRKRKIELSKHCFLQLKVKNGQAQAYRFSTIHGSWHWLQIVRSSSRNSKASYVRNKHIQIMMRIVFHSRYIAIFPRHVQGGGGPPRLAVK